jgi:hypothetical protein
MDVNPRMPGWWFGTFGLFFPSYWEFHGISSSQLTFTPSFSER